MTNPHVEKPQTQSEAFIENVRMNAYKEGYQEGFKEGERSHREKLMSDEAFIGDLKKQGFYGLAKVLEELNRPTQVEKSAAKALKKHEQTLKDLGKS